MNTFDQIETALNAARDYFQASHRDFAALRDAGAGHEQRINELAALIESTQREVQTAREATTARETALRAQLDEGEQRLNQCVQALTLLQTEQESLATLDGRIAEQAAALQTAQERMTALDSRVVEQAATFQIAQERMTALDSRVAEQAATLQTAQERLATLDGRVATHTEGFGKFETAIRQLHGELVALRQRLAALEANATAELLGEHTRRLDEAEQRDQEQRQTLTELRQALEQVASRQPATGKSNTTLLGILIAVIICAVLALVILNTGAR